MGSDIIYSKDIFISRIKGVIMNDIKINYDGKLCNTIFVVLLIHKLIGLMYSLPTLSWSWVFAPIIVNAFFCIVLTIISSIIKRTEKKM